MTEYNFTNNWFAHAEEVWPHLIPLLPNAAGNRQFLEIGSFEGRSAVWITENMMQDGDELYCVDTWKGGEEHGNEDMNKVEGRFRDNLLILHKKFPLRRVFQSPGTSLYRMAKALVQDYSYDFIYIDGSHVAKDVLTDACVAWSLLKPNGIMVFDDYLWGDARDVLHRPKAAIDAFTNIFAEDLNVVHVGHQLVVRKKGE